MDKILAIMPVHNRRDTTLAMLENLQKVVKNNFFLDVLVIDDGSTDGTEEAITDRFPDVKIERGDGNLWWAGAINRGFCHALKESYDFVYTLNDDIKLSLDTLQRLYEQVKNRKASVCSSIFVNDLGIVVLAGWKVSGIFRRFKNEHAGKIYNAMPCDVLTVHSLSSKSTLIPIEIIHDVGMFDTVHFIHNHSDIDYFDRVRLHGYQNLVDCGSVIITYGSDSNFHDLLLNSSLKNILKTFFNIKYGNNFSTLYNIATVRQGFLIGHLTFLIKLTPYVIWLVLKLFFPKYLLRYVISVKTK